MRLSALSRLLSRLIGEFDNREQWEQKKGGEDPRFPLAVMRNTVIHDRIENLPRGLPGKFILSERYFQGLGRLTGRPGLYYASENQRGEAVLEVYQPPKGLTLQTLKITEGFHLDFLTLQKAEHLNAMVFTEEEGRFHCGVEAAPTRVMKLSIDISAGENVVSVQETMWIDGKMAAGEPEPFLYRRNKDVESGSRCHAILQK